MKEGKNKGEMCKEKTWWPIREEEAFIHDDFNKIMTWKREMPILEFGTPEYWEYHTRKIDLQKAAIKIRG